MAEYGAGSNVLETTGEFKVISRSPLVGMTIGKIEEDWKVNVVHVHPGISEDVTRTNPPPGKKIEPNHYLKVFGTYENVMKLARLATKKG